MGASQDISSRRVHSFPAGKGIEVQVDGETVSVYEGESVAAVLMLAGRRTFTQPSRFNLARTVYCGMGLCHQCLVTVDGVADVRACMTVVRPGMQISTRPPEERSSV